MGIFHCNLCNLNKGKNFLSVILYFHVRFNLFAKATLEFIGFKQRLIKF